jgi:hypothetical protein
MARTKGSKNKVTTIEVTPAVAEPKKRKPRAAKVEPVAAQKLDQKQLARALKRNSRIAELQAAIAKAECALAAEFSALKADLRDDESAPVKKPRKPRAPKQLTESDMFAGEGGDDDGQ